MHRRHTNTCQCDIRQDVNDLAKGRTEESMSKKLANLREPHSSHQLGSTQLVEQIKPRDLHITLLRSVEDDGLE